jgi:hypothetical protein
MAHESLEIECCCHWQTASNPLSLDAPSVPHHVTLSGENEEIAYERGPTPRPADALRAAAEVSVVRPLAAIVKFMDVLHAYPTFLRWRFE